MSKRKPKRRRGHQGPKPPGEKRMSIAAEAARMRVQAIRYVEQVMPFGALVFFSTESGDAWMLDPVDSLALALARDGVAQPGRIIEADDDYVVDWEMQFRIEGDAFVCDDGEGTERVIIGYPTAALEAALRQVREHIEREGGPD
ncbi:MAG: hypothetical protein AB7Q97_19180 [Gammaproteobacteria bacterium]